MLTEAEVSKKCLGFINDVQNNSKMESQRERAEAGQDFYRGHHWSEEEYGVYKSKGVEPITINRCKPAIKSAVGMYLRNKQSIRVLPRRGATEAVARVWSELVKHTEDLTHAGKVYTEVFRRGNIDSESYIKLEIDKTRNPNGQPVFRSRSLNDVEADPNAREYDLNISSKFVIDKEWVDKDWLEIKYPDFEDMFAEQSFALDGTDSTEDQLAYYLSDDTEINEDETDDMEMKRKYRYRLRKVYWREAVKGLLITDKKTRAVKKIADDKIARKMKKLVKKSKRFESSDEPMYRLHETVFLGRVFLEDTIDPLGAEITKMPLTRFSPFWDEGYAISILDDIIPLNREENIHRTQSIKILNQTANSGWIVGGGEKKDQAQLANYGSVEGVVLDRRKFNNMVEKIKPNPIPVGFLTMGSQFEQDVKRVSGFDDATQGYETGQSDSGRALGIKASGNQLTAEPIFDNFYYTLELFGDLLIEVLRRNNVYTDEEIKAVVNEASFFDEKTLERAKVNLSNGLYDADLPEPRILQFDPQSLAAVKPEDQAQAYQTIKRGIEASQEYNRAYPAMKENWDAVIKHHATLELLKRLKSESVAEYGVSVTVSPSAPTERIAQRLQIDAINQQYPGIIPPDILIDMTDLPMKTEIKQRIRQNAQLAQTG